MDNLFLLQFFFMIARTGMPAKFKFLRCVPLGQIVFSNQVPPPSLHLHYAGQLLPRPLPLLYHLFFPHHLPLHLLLVELLLVDDHLSKALGEPAPEDMEHFYYIMILIQSSCYTLYCTKGLTPYACYFLVWVESMTNGWTCTHTNGELFSKYTGRLKKNGD